MIVNKKYFKMKIGYPCINKTVGCTANSTFRLINYSEENLTEKVKNNLDCLEIVLKYNLENNFLFFRISSDLIPFASHPICKFNWQDFFKKRFKEIGDFIIKNNFRISMHPDQFVLINAEKKEIIEKSIAELKWHCEVLDLMGLDVTAKVQIHVGGIYKNKDLAMKRFIENYNNLPDSIKKRLVIENDDRLFSLKDCLYISENSGIPIIFDSFHHKCLNNNEIMTDALKLAKSTWEKKDGLIMVDYSSQEPNSKIGKHISHIDIEDFRDFIRTTKEVDFDIMLEIKDKENSAQKAIEVIKRIRG